MPKASDAYPKRNLPGSAEDWGRRVEGVQQELDTRLANLEQSVGIHASTLYGQSLINQAASFGISDNTDAINLTTAVPAMPANVSIVSNIGYWLDDGTAKSVVTISFNPVTKDIHNNDINIEKYELWSHAGNDEPSFNISTASTAIGMSDWVPGVPIKFSLRAKSIYGIASGFTAEVTVTPADPANIVPKAPTNVALVSNTAEFDETDSAVATINVSWDAVTESTDNDPITPVEYELWINGSPYYRTPTNSIQFTAYSGSVNVVRVRAKSIVNAWGDLSADPGLSITAASPATITRAPNDPTLETSLGIVTVSWDGTYVSGGTNGVGGVYVEVKDGTNWLRQGAALRTAGSVPVQGASGTTMTVRLSAHDMLNRTTGVSSEVSITVQGVTTSDTTTEFDEWIAAQAGGAHITKSETEPTSGVEGDLWFKTNPEGTIENIYIHNGTEFVLNQLIADSILVANSVTAKTINAQEVFADSAFLNSLQAGAISVGILTTDTIMSDNNIVFMVQDIEAANNTAGQAASDAQDANSTAGNAALVAGNAALVAGNAATAIETLNTAFIVTPTDARVQSLDGTHTVQMTSTGINILQGTNAVSSWSGQKFTVANIEVSDSATIGNHKISKYPGSTNRTVFNPK